MVKGSMAGQAAAGNSLAWSQRQVNIALGFALAAAAEQRLGFIEDAQAARAQMLKSGLGFDAQEVHTYLKARMSDKAAPKPKATPWQS